MGIGIIVLFLLAGLLGVLIGMEISNEIWIQRIEDIKKEQGQEYENKKL